MSNPFSIFPIFISNLELLMNELFTTDERADVQITFDKMDKI
jgi:hypothetical protein